LQRLIEEESVSRSFAAVFMNTAKSAISKLATNSCASHKTDPCPSVEEVEELSSKKHVIMLSTVWEIGARS
jgi:hypothetical protein